MHMEEKSPIEYPQTNQRDDTEDFRGNDFTDCSMLCTIRTT